MPLITAVFRIWGSLPSRNIGGDRIKKYSRGHIKMDDARVARAMSKLVDCKYSLGDISGGFDCYNSLKHFYEECGIDFPTQFRDWDIKNYPDKWVYDPEIGRQIFFDFLMTLGKPIDSHYVMRGDLIILK